MLVNLVAPSFMDDLFDPTLEMLAARGHAKRRFHDHAGFLDDVEAQRAMAVLVAIPNLKVDAAIMDAAPVLRGIVSPVTGTEGFDEAAAAARGIVVANGQIEENYKSMADAAVLLVLASLYDLKGTERLLRDGGARPRHLTARMVMGKRVGLIGFGQIAQAVAARLQAFEAEIVTTIRTPRPLPGTVQAVALDDLLASSDVVVVTAALNSATRGLLDAARLERMKDNVVFVNVARGGIVDDDALARLAQARPAMRLALDVFDPEPLRSDSPLRALPNAILTPHMIGHTVETHDKLPLTLRDTVADLLEGRIPAFVRNPAAIDLWRRRFGDVGA